MGIMATAAVKRLVKLRRIAQFHFSPPFFNRIDERMSGGRRADIHVWFIHHVAMASKTDSRWIVH